MTDKRGGVISRRRLLTGAGAMAAFSALPPCGRANDPSVETYPASVVRLGLQSVYDLWGSTNVGLNRPLTSTPPTTAFPTGWAVDSVNQLVYAAASGSVANVDFSGWQVILTGPDNATVVPISFTNCKFSF